MEKGKPFQRVGDYELLDRLAVGGMGQLWRVRHVKLGAVYVAKQLRPEYRQDPEFAARFLHEAQLVANLKHPNIVQVFGYDEEHMLYLMEYVEGMDLDRLLRARGRLEFSDARCIIEAVADTIGYAHRQVDLIHRDIKPSNILIAISSPDDPIERSNIKLTDFGIAKVLSVNQRITLSSGMVMGTVHYMAPEQFEGEADKPSDVYSIGILYYQLLTGTLPFDGPTAFVIRDKHLNKIPPTPRDVNPGVPLEDSTIVMKCLEKDPHNRYQDATELSEALAASRPTTKTVTLPHLRAKAPRPTTPTKPAERAEEVTPKPAEKPTEKAAEAPPKPARRRRLLRLALLGVAAVAAVGFLATWFLKPRYEIRWSTLRSDPLDTPNGIQVSICPRIGLGLFWWPVGTIAERAPPNWSNWTTWFNSIDVKFSDGLYRHFVLTCRKPEGRSYVDFGGATFAELAQRRQAEVVEDMSRVGDYINAVLAPHNVATARSLADVQRSLDRVGDLPSRAKNVGFDKTRLNAYRRAVTHLVAAADALADGQARQAEDRFRRAEPDIQQIAQAEQAELPKDFLFRQTLGTAVVQLKERAGKASRLVEGLEPVADSATSVQYTLEKYRAANTAVAELVLFAPGRSAYNELLKKLKDGRGDLEPLMQELGEAAPPAIATARRYLAKLDHLLRHTPAPGQETPYRVAVLELMDDALTASMRLERPSWLDKCFAKEQLAFFDLVQRFWRHAHRARFTSAAELCRELASDRIAKASALSADTARLHEASKMFDDAGACLDAIRKAENSSEEGKRAATGLLSTCCVKHAMCQFRLAADAPEGEEKRLAVARRLLDRGVVELSGASPDVAEDARVLRHVLKSIAEPRRKLAACRRENFASRGAYGGRVGTLFAALEAYERLAREMDKHADHPCSRAALAPFTHLRTESCEGFTLYNAAACWLLANAVQSCENGRYSEACGFLAHFLRVPGEKDAERESPLKRLLPDAITAKAEMLGKLAGYFDETRVLAEGLPRKEPWKKIWDRRLEAKPLVGLELPQTVSADAMPERYKGQEAQWSAIYAQMRKLHGHYRSRILAEAELRQLEGEVERLVVRGADGVRANPRTATPDAVAKCSEALKRLRDSGRYKHSDDHPSRIDSVQRDISALKADVTGPNERIAEMLAKPDPKGALDEVRTWRAALGEVAELRLTQKASMAWIKMAVKDADQDNFDAALEKFKAMREHEQIRRHGSDQAIKGALDGIVKTVHYCEGQRSLALGARGFAVALPKFQQAAPYRDAESIAKQIGAFQETYKLAAAAPFKAWNRFSQLLKAKGLNLKIRGAADKAAGEVRRALIAGAAASTKAFNEALVKGGWEQYLDKAVLLEDRLARLNTFLKRVEGLEVRQADEQDQGQIVFDKREVKLTRKRVLKFNYRLPGSAKVPITVEQSIEWTVRYLPAEEGKDRRWVIADWVEAD